MAEVRNWVWLDESLGPKDKWAPAEYRSVVQCPACATPFDRALNVGVALEYHNRLLRRDEHNCTIHPTTHVRYFFVQCLTCCFRWIENTAYREPIDALFAKAEAAELDFATTALSEPGEEPYR